MTEKKKGRGHEADRSFEKKRMKGMKIEMSFFYFMPDRVSQHIGVPQQ